MSEGQGSDRASLLGAGGVLLAVLCCVAGPATLGAIAGGALGSTFGILGAVVVAACFALVATLGMRRRRRGRGPAC